jgi:Caspase domain
MKTFANIGIGIILAISPLSQSACAETLVFHASISGRPTLDQGEGGGNPFASSLIEILARPSVKLSEFSTELTALTRKKSGNFQSADVPQISQQETWSVVPPAIGERRRALVLVFSDYQKSGGAQSLPGAKHDADRISLALSGAGFEVEVATDLDLNSARVTLAAFARRTADADVGLIYATGHGVEVAQTIYLLPGDYPVQLQNTALASRALPLSTLADALKARRTNLLFYGGCRDNPFGN